MTTKQIAEATGKPEQTVRNWIRSLASKSDVVKSKLDASSPMNPADYDLAESCLIIEEGLGKAAADVYRTNAVNAALQEKAARSRAYPEMPPLPSAAQLHELRMAVEKKVMTSLQYQQRIGVAPISGAETPKQIEGPSSSSSEWGDGPWTAAELSYLTGLNSATIRSKLNRNRSLRELPYSQLVGSYRIFYRPFLAEAFGRIKAIQ